MEKRIKVIEFSGESCANCYSLMPILHNILINYSDVELVHIEVDEEKIDIISKYQIDRVPTILILLDEKEVGRCRGYQPEEILALWLEDKIENARESRYL